MAEETSRIVVGVDTSQLGKAKTEGVRTFESIREAAEKASGAVANTEKALASTASATRAASTTAERFSEDEKKRLRETFMLRQQDIMRTQQAAQAVRQKAESVAQASARELSARAEVRQQLKGDVRELALYGRAVDASSATAVAAWRAEASAIRAQAEDVRISRIEMLKLDGVIRQTENSFKSQTAIAERLTVGTTNLTTAQGRFTLQGRQAANVALSLGFALQSVAAGADGAGRKMEAALQGVSALALAFGPGGLWVAALAQAGLAITSMFNKTRDEISKTRKLFEDEIDRMIVASDRMGAAAKLNTLNMGGARQGAGGFFVGSIDEAKARLADLEGGWKKFQHTVFDNVPVVGAALTLGLAAKAEKETRDLKKSVGEMEQQRKDLEAVLARPIHQPMGANTVTVESPATRAAREEAEALKRTTVVRKQSDASRAESDRAQKAAITAEIQRLTELEAATDAYYARVNAGHISNVRTVEDFTRQREEAENLLAATKNGEMALERYHVSLAIANVERGREVALTADQVAKVRQEIEARDEATRKTAAYNEAQKTTTAVIQKQAAVATSPFTSAVENMQRAFSDGIYDMLSGGINSFKDFANTVKDIMLKMVAQVVSARVLQKVLGGAMAGLAGVAGTAGAQGGSHGAGLSGGLGLGASAMSLAGSGIGGFGAGYGIGSMSGSRTMGALGGAAGGAAAGFAIGGPVGAIIGGVSGLVGGLFGSAKKAKEAARTMEDARKAFALNMSQFVATAYGTNNALADALRQNEATRNELMKQADAANPGRKNEPARHVEEAKIMGAAAANAERLRAEFRAGVDEQIRGFSETGRAENDRIAIEKQYQENLKSAAAAGMSAVKVEELRTLQLGALAKAEAAYAEALRYTSQVRDEDLAVRQMAADGDARGAADRRFMLDQDREMHDAQMAGWTETQLAQLKYIHGMEAQNRATEAAAHAAQEAADAQSKLAESQRQAALAMQDLDVRMLFATGKDAEGAQLRFDLGQSNEMEEAQRAGRSSEYLAKLDDVQRLEAKRRQAELDAAAVDALISETGGSTGSRSLNAATSATSAQTDRLLAYTATSTEYLRRIANAVEGNSGSTSGVVPRTAPDIGEIDRGLFSATGQASRSAGNPGILI